MIDELPFNSTQPELEKILDGVVKAGEKIIEVYNTDFTTEKKDDDSPITQADIESNRDCVRRRRNLSDNYKQDETMGYLCL